MKQKIIRVGPHSLGVVVPAPFVHSLGVHKGDNVDVNTNMERGSMTIHFSGAVQLGLLNQKSPARMRG